MTGIMQAVLGGSFAPGPPTVIGQAYGGGFYAGQISTTANGVATHYLIIAPKATGERSALKWGTLGNLIGATSLIDGPGNTLLAYGTGSLDYEAARFCYQLNNSGGLNGYTDWYLPAQNELEVLYYYLKATTNANDTASGSNANAVSPEPLNTNYTTSSPAQTSAGSSFISGGSETLSGPASGQYWTSTELTSNNARRQNYSVGAWASTSKGTTSGVRAIRRIPV